MRTLSIAARVRQPISRGWLPAIVLGTWIVTFALFIPEYIIVIRQCDDLFVATAASLAIFWINVAELFALYHLVSFLSSLCVRRRVTLSLGEGGKESPRVAIFYLCMNDFDESAFRSCIDLDYTNCRIFVLDDSTNAEESRRIDEIVGAYQERACVIRRSDRRGFKAGSLNHGISKIANENFVYYCIVDADERLPPEFLRRTVFIAERDYSLGFVQAAHRTYADTNIGKLLGGGLSTHWNYFLPVRNYTGFQYFIGHGALLRASAVRAVDGFNHVVAEDLDIATRMRMKGYKGYFDFETQCLEAFPHDHHAFRRRSEKVVTGTLEFLFRRYPQFAKCRDVSIGEKLDVLLGAGIVLLPAVFIGVLLVMFLIFPALHVLVHGTEVSYDEALRRGLSPLDHPGFMLTVMFTVVAPALYTLPDLLARSFPNMRAIARLGGSYLSINIALAAKTLKWLFKPKQEFIATGDRYVRNIACIENCVIFALAGSFVLIGMMMGSVCLMVIGASAIYIPVTLRSTLEHSVADLLMCVPLLIAIPASFIDPVAATVGAGMCSSIACIHH